MTESRNSTFDRQQHGRNLWAADKLQNQGKHAKAAELLRQNLWTTSKHLSGSDPMVLSDRDSLSDCLRGLGDFKGAVELDEVTLPLRQRIDDQAEDTIATLQSLADNLSSLGQYGRAIPLYRSALSTRTKALGLGHEITLQTKHNLASSLYEFGQPREASRINRQVMKIREATLAADNVDLVATIHNLATNSYSLGDLERAIQLTKRNLQALQGIRAPTDEQLLEVIALQDRIKSTLSGAERVRALASKTETLVTPLQAQQAADASQTPQQLKPTAHHMLSGAKTRDADAVHNERQARVNESPKIEGSARKGLNKAEAEIIKRKADDREESRPRMTVNNNESVNVSPRPDTRPRSDRIDPVAVPKTVSGDATPLFEQLTSSSNRRKVSDRTKDAQATPSAKMPSNTEVSSDRGIKLDRPKVSHSVSEKMERDRMDNSRLLSPAFMTDPQGRPRSNDEQRLSSSKPVTPTTPTTLKPRSRSVGTFSTEQSRREPELQTFSNTCDARDGVFYDHTSIRAKPRWLDRFRETQHLVAQSRKPQQRRVKVAVLDTGVEKSHPFFQNSTWEHRQYGPPKDRIRDYRSFVHGEAGDCDKVGHGTHCTTLLMDLAPNTDIYVGRISAGGTSHIDPEVVAKAIIHAADEWKVAIISMSFGWTEKDYSVASAIDYAVARGVLLCAAASNEGANDEVAFPARYAPVICVHSANENGKPSDFTPNCLPSEHNFAVLGENVQAAWPGQNDGRSLNGTSVATPILAAVMALIIEFVDQKPRKTPEEKRIKDHRVMTQVLLAMSEGVSGYHYVRPWELMNAKWDRGRNESNIQHSIKT